MDKNLREILDIDKDNLFLKYIAQRVQKDDYRGVHISQHNRYDLVFVSKFIDVIYDKIGGKLSEIPRGDYSDRENKKDYDINDYEKFQEITNIIHDKVGKTTYNSIKKNFFVDFHRMGLIKRYDKNKNETNPHKRTAIHFISISDDGIKLKNSKNIVEKYRIFTDILDKNLFDNFLGYLTDLLFDSDYKNDTISIYEFMFIFTDTTIDNHINLLDSYRNLKIYQKDKFLKLIQNYANPYNFIGDKKDKRDFHNWINESQQIFSLLKQTSYFQTDEKNENIALNIGTYGIFSIDNLKRSDTPKQEYFKLHDIKKRTNFELHHIIAISKAKNKEELKLLDHVNNLIYLQKKKHFEFTKKLNKNVNLSINPLQAKFYDFDKNVIIANNHKDSMYSKEHKILKDIDRYNKKALEKIYQYDKTI
ncbi:MAG: hypothetical protein DRG11_05555 [Epsilonproteobacteria bacterium]|nr:MAG: hypothetical protein DRG11_05555 [Campylobacterota bacterium]